MLSESCTTMEQLNTADIKAIAGRTRMLESDKRPARRPGQPAPRVDETTRCRDSLQAGTEALIRA